MLWRLGGHVCAVVRILLDRFRTYYCCSCSSSVQPVNHTNGVFYGSTTGLSTTLSLAAVYLVHLLPIAWHLRRSARTRYDISSRFQLRGIVRERSGLHVFCLVLCDLMLLPQFSFAIEDQLPLSYTTVHVVAGSTAR